MKKLSLFTSIVSLFAVVACSSPKSSESSILSLSSSEEEVTSTSSSTSGDTATSSSNISSTSISSSTPSSSSSSSASSSASSSSSSSSSKPQEVLITKLSFKQESIDLAINRGQQVEYTIEPYNATNKNLRWASTDYEVAAVTKEGRITALGEGQAVISATTMDGTLLTASLTVNVYPIAVNELSLEVSNKTLKVGETFQIEPLIYPSNATYKGVTYASNNDLVATVSDKGLVTATGDGETDIAVTSERYPDIKTNFHVKVNAVIAEKLLYRLSDIEMRVGENYFFAPTLIPTNTTLKTITYANSNPDVVSVSQTGEIYAIGTGEAEVTATSVSNPELATTLKVTVKSADALIKTSLSYTYKDFAYNNLYNIDNADYKTTNALIVPVWFSDSNTYISNNNKEAIREDIEKAYLGTNEETGWRSVKTFYEEEGRGRYSLTGVVTDWFNCNLPSSYFYHEETGANATDSLVTSALSWYKKTYGVANMKGFDADFNGYVDSIILIYAAPDYSVSGNPYAPNMWAYTSWLRKEAYRNYDDPGANAFFWASYDFMYGEDHPHNDNRYAGGDTRFCNIDTHTYIHEFGHALGLNDYYDYSQSYSPAGGFTMQDNNVGGHDPYSLLTYGFVDPYVVTDVATITINDFQSSGDVVLLANRSINSPFDEYILLELYTPTGLNEFDTLHQYTGSYPQGVNEVGIRIWHVDGRLVYGTSTNDLTPEHITTNPLISGYKVWNMMSNTYYSYSTQGNISPLGRDYENYNELQLIRNDVDVTHKCKDDFNSNCLFKAGDTFSIDKFNKQFVNRYYLNDGSTFSFTVEVESIENNQATLKITKQRRKESEQTFKIITISFNPSCFRLM